MNASNACYRQTVVSTVDLYLTWGVFSSNETLNREDRLLYSTWYKVQGTREIYAFLCFILLFNVSARSRINST